MWGKKIRHMTCMCFELYKERPDPLLDKYIFSDEGWKNVVCVSKSIAKFVYLLPWTNFVMSVGYKMLCQFFPSDDISMAWSFRL
jgi:hypothetical protein